MEKVAGEQPTRDTGRAIWHSRGYLPHFDVECAIQSVSFRLYDSVPAQVIEQWKEELNWKKHLTADSSESILLRKKIEYYEDTGIGDCHLRDNRIASLTKNALLYFDGQRYRILEWCIMPNHVHVLFEPIGDCLLSNIIHNWKSFIAHQANKLLNRKREFWMPDYFDRFIRDEKHFSATKEYIIQNPVKASLVDSPEKWPWSSAANAE